MYRKQYMISSAFAASTGNSLPEAAFYMVGKIEEAVEKAQRLAMEAA